MTPAKTDSILVNQLIMFGGVSRPYQDRCAYKSFGV